MINLDHKFQASGILIYDDAKTNDKDASNQIVFHASGETKKIDIDFHVVKGNSKISEQKTRTHLGSLIIMNALKNGYDEKTKVEASLLLDGEEIAIQAKGALYDTVLNRVYITFPENILLSKLGSIHIKGAG
jgi:hypothetical protein